MVGKNNYAEYLGSMKACLENRNVNLQLQWAPKALFMRYSYCRHLMYCSVVDLEWFFSDLDPDPTYFSAGPAPSVHNFSKILDINFTFVFLSCDL